MLLRDLADFYVSVLFACCTLLNKVIQYKGATQVKLHKGFSPVHKNVLAVFKNSG